jgi:hypothetical protein
MKYIIINKENEEEKVCDIFFNKKTEAEQYLNANFTELERENLTIVSGIERYIIVMEKDKRESFVKTLDDVIKGGFANCADYKRKSFSCLGIANIAKNRLATFAIKNGIDAQFHIQEFII